MSPAAEVLSKMPAGHPGTVPAVFGPACAVADAILYEGYVLYPYRRSSGKNKVRWQFGVLLPREWAEEHGLDDTGVAGSAESWWQQTECLLAGAADVVHVRVRFLQLQRRWVEQRGADGAYRAADQVVVNGRAEFGFDEAAPQEADITASVGDLLKDRSSTDIHLPAGCDVEALTERGAGEVARVVRRREAVSARVWLSVQACGPRGRLLRLRVRVENTGRGLHPGVGRDAALGRALIATHTLITAPGGSFVSLLEPPDWARTAARGCRNVHTFPVLAGPGGRSSVLLSSPVILYDHPGVAPESPGDLHDAAEIDEILSLRTLTLTDQEKAEARATDPRAAAIVDRVDDMPPEVFARLHGAIRSLQPITGTGVPPPQPGPLREEPGTAEGELPGPDGAGVGAIRVGKGSRVRLRPRARGTDAHDMFLAGRMARVEAVLTDMDGGCHLAVTIEGDPAAELNVWYGRFRYFRPDEVEPLDGDAGNAAGRGGGEPGRTNA